MLSNSQTQPHQKIEITNLKLFECDQKIRILVETSLWRTHKKTKARITVQKKYNVENAKIGRMSKASAGVVAIQSETNKIEQQQQQKNERMEKY